MKFSSNAPQRSIVMQKRKNAFQSTAIILTFLNFGRETRSSRSCVILSAK